MTILTRRVGLALALALAVLGPAQAQAVPHHGICRGRSPSNRSGGSFFPGGQVYRLHAPAKVLYLTYTFDTAESEPPLGGFGPDDAALSVVPASFQQLTTSGGYNASGRSSRSTGATCS